MDYRPDFSGNLAVMLLNSITSCNTGVLVQSNGLAHLEANTITAIGSGGGVHVVSGRLAALGSNPNGAFQNYVTNGSGDGIVIDATAGAIDPITQNDLSFNAGFGLVNNSASLVTAEVNWWGNNLAGPVAAEVSGNVDFDPWLASGTNQSPAAGFHPFLFATTSGTITTLAGTAGSDNGRLSPVEPVLMGMNGAVGFTPTAQFVTLNIQLGAGTMSSPRTYRDSNRHFRRRSGNDTLAGTDVRRPGTSQARAAAAFRCDQRRLNVEALRGGTAADTFVFGAAVLSLKASTETSASTR